MTRVLLRPARLEDLAAVSLIEKASFDRPYPDWFMLMLLEMSAGNFFVAEAGRRIVGYVVAVPLRSGACHLVSIAVDPAHRGRGIGRRLLSRVEESCSKQGYRSIILEVEYTNHAAQRLYTSTGYRYAGVMPSYYGEGRHALLMVKPLRAAGPG